MAFRILLDANPKKKAIREETGCYLSICGRNVVEMWSKCGRNVVDVYEMS